MLGHAPSASTSSLSQELRAGSSYAPSVYAQSTLAASTVMPGMAMQPVRNTATVQWQEGHCLQWRPHEDKATCSICEEKSDEGLYRCSGRFQISPLIWLPLTPHRMHHLRPRKMRPIDLHRLPYGFPTRSSACIVRAMLRQPAVHVPSLPCASQWRPQEVWHALSVQDGGVYEGSASGKRAIPDCIATNSVFQRVHPRTRKHFWRRSQDQAV